MPAGHGRGIRADMQVYANYMIPILRFCDCKANYSAQTREEIMRKMERALDEFIIEGIKTTIPFHQQLMKMKKIPEKAIITTTSGNI